MFQQRQAGKKKYHKNKVNCDLRDKRRKFFSCVRVCVTEREMDGLKTFLTLPLSLSLPLLQVLVVRWRRGRPLLPLLWGALPVALRLLVPVGAGTPGHPWGLPHCLSRVSVHRRALHPRPCLEGIYYRICRQEFRADCDQITQVAKLKQSFTNRGQRWQTLAEMHRRLVCFCKLTEVPDVTKRRHRKKPNRHHGRLPLQRPDGGDQGSLGGQERNAAPVLLQNLPIRGASQHVQHR